MENKEIKTEEKIKNFIPSIPDIVVKVITDPAGFYKDMPKTGGFIEPLIFMALMGVAGGLIMAVLSILGLHPVGGLVIAISSIIFVPILVTILGFIGAAILFLIWKLMGSNEDYETAYRCAAFAAAITPITTIINLVPYIGPAIGIIWMIYLIVTASIEVHKIVPKVARIVFGIIGAVFLLSSISAEFTTRKLTKEFKSFEKSMDNFEDMSPEEAGKAVGEFFKGLQEGAGKEETYE